MAISSPYFLFYHKHPTSAMTRFLCFSYGSIVGLAPLPALSQVAEAAERDGVSLHPAAHIASAEQVLGLIPGTLIVNAGFHAAVETPQGIFPVLLLRFPGYETPAHLETVHEARFIRITEARTLASVDLALMRKAYEEILG